MRPKDLSGFCDLAGGDTTGADIHAFNNAFQVDFDALQVREETAQGFSDNLGSGTAGPLDLAAPLIFDTRNRAFIANNACLWHNFVSDGTVNKF